MAHKGRKPTTSYPAAGQTVRLRAAEVFDNGQRYWEFLPMNRKRPMCRYFCKAANAPCLQVGDEVRGVVERVEADDEENFFSDLNVFLARVW
jgi:hypothetical protein